MKYPWDEMKTRIQNAVFMAAAAMFCSLPMFYYQFMYLSSMIHNKQPEKLYYLAMSQSFILFSLALLCSLVGFLYSDRLHLPGFGNWSDIAIWLPAGLALGILMTPIRYGLIDRNIIQTIPELFPTSVGWALVQMAGTTIPQEVIVRFGLLTICCYLLQKFNYSRHPLPAIGMISAFGTFVTYQSMIRFEVAAKLGSSQIFLILFLTFCLQWIYCEIYIRKGFVVVACVHFGLTVKYLIYAVVL